MCSSDLTVGDLELLRRDGLADALVRRAHAGRPILGICGGYQMLGERIVDEVESRRGTVPGLGLLPVETVFERDKIVRRRRGHSPLFGGAPAEGYEIRHGRPRWVVRTPSTGAAPIAGSRPRPVFIADDAQPDGCALGAITGTSWHGVMEADSLRREMVTWVAVTSRPPVPVDTEGKANDPLEHLRAASLLRGPNARVSEIPTSGRGMAFCARRLSAFEVLADATARAIGDDAVRSLMHSSSVSRFEIT